MLSVSEALAAIEATVRPLAPVSISLSNAPGLVLAEDVPADRDSPPFDKALMDGYAVRAEDVPGGRATLRVIEEVTAGQVPRLAVGPGQATRIMTGAPIPVGADAVVQVEHTRAVDGDAAAVEIETGSIQPGRSVLPRAASARAGDCIVARGARLRPQEIGCLAEVGRSQVLAFPRPRVAVLATGDELVPINATPGPGQIRNSNEAMLVAQLTQAGVMPVPLGIARDNEPALREKISLGLACDALILSGGVSAGMLDLVPSVLSDLGVEQVFHKVRVKPGQPLWFGACREKRPRTASAGADLRSEFANHADSPCYVFGLPGNPVSSMVCFELFARTAFRRLMGITPAAPKPWRATLTCEFRHSGPRPTYHPAHLDWTSEGATITPIKWVGSADLIATAGANALAVFSEGEKNYTPGTTIDVIPL